MPTQGKYEFKCGSCGHKYYSDNKKGLTRCPNCRKIIGQTFDTEKGDGELHTGRVALEKIKGAAHERIINKIDEKISGGGNNNSNSKSSSSGSIGAIVLILIIAFFIWGVIVSPGLESGFWQSKLGNPLKSVLQGTRDVAKFTGTQISNIGKILKGEEVFSFESGEAEIKQRTGLSFGGASVFGSGDELTVFGDYTNEEFGVHGDIIVGKIDEAIPELPDVELGCETDGISGEIEMDNANVENGKAVFKIFNPKPFDESRIPFRCKFDPARNPALTSSLLRNLNLKTMKLSLTYPLEINNRLDVFVLPREKYEEYIGRYDLAFDELHNGAYANWNSKILSKSKYESDVDIALWFDNQPLGANDKEYNLRFAFKNKNPKNKFKIEKFEIELPDGMSFSNSECEKFNIYNDRGALMERSFASINNALNDEASGEHFGSCKIRVDERILGGSSADLVKARDVNVTMLYEYTIIAEKDVTLRQPSEDEVVADSEKVV